MISAMVLNPQKGVDRLKAHEGTIERVIVMRMFWGTDNLADRRSLTKESEVSIALEVLAVGSQA